MLTSSQIKQQFLDFYRTRGHEIAAGAPLVPGSSISKGAVNLWTVPFQTLSLGMQPSNAGRNLATVQTHFSPSLRVLTERHPTFYQMLSACSNASKQEAILWAWQLLSEAFQLERDRLFVSLDSRDEESYRIWRDVVQFDHERIVQNKWNYWTGDHKGHAGPTCRIHYDVFPQVDATNIAEQDDFTLVQEKDTDFESLDYTDYLLLENNLRFLTCCTLVFKVEEYQSNLSRTPLAKPYIETGIELERMARILQGKPSIYESDQYSPIIEMLEAISGVPYPSLLEESTEQAVEQISPHAPLDDTSSHRRNQSVGIRNAFWATADHLRLLVNFVADNHSIPAYNSKGRRQNLNHSSVYFSWGTWNVPHIRKYTAQLLLQGQLLSISRPFITDLISEVIRITENEKNPDDEHTASRQDVSAVIRILQQEETAFLQRLDTFRTQCCIKAYDLHRLHTEYGLPLNLLEKWAIFKKLNFEKELYLKQCREAAAAWDD
jgi:alanyl-tRNA synthetase